MLIALAPGCRPQYALAALLLCAVYIWYLRGPRREALWFGAPIAICGFLLLWYNFARFGNPLEFGTSYQLTASTSTRGVSLHSAKPGGGFLLSALVPTSSMGPVPLRDAQICGAKSSHVRRKRNRTSRHQPDGGRGVGTTAPDRTMESGPAQQSDPGRSIRRDSRRADLHRPDRVRRGALFAGFFSGPIGYFHVCLALVGDAIPGLVAAQRCRRDRRRQSLEYGHRGCPKSGLQRRSPGPEPPACFERWRGGSARAPGASDYPWMA